MKEDTTWDGEVNHSSEEVSYLAIDGAGTLTASGAQTANGVTRSFPLTVPVTGRVADVNVTVDIDHAHTSDLTVVLIAPDGASVELFSGVGGAGTNFSSTTLDDEAATPIASASAPFTGSFQPETSLTNFDGRPSDGTWTLEITDSAANPNVGALLDWSLTLDVSTDPTGNVNHDSHVDADDIDLLFARIGTSGGTYDLNGDGDIDTEDVDELVLNFLGTNYGDADVDMDVDDFDYQSVTANFDPGAQDGWHGWSMGNFDGDDDIDTMDLLKVVLGFDPSGIPLMSSTTNYALLPDIERAPQSLGGQMQSSLTNEDSSVSDQAIESTPPRVRRVDSEHPASAQHAVQSVLFEDPWRSVTPRHRSFRSNEHPGPLFVDSSLSTLSRKK